jgi:hypothetical protein
MTAIYNKHEHFVSVISIYVQKKNVYNTKEEVRESKTRNI